ncbi:DUF6114 domain-containing protein [Oryzihumus leptocrescens]|uniref:Integral membrane protein n=1 Tax=Oryzihumus leptocrescens TaxID=297536 RepID=A0A542ZHU1_9MICO|nr:DUF6114 domain-containing protein [Oryzihumus leptocrescens]TQL59932.1 hypothetical protein FB474_1307 [Oryzihumus leptocrescens]
MPDDDASRPSESHDLPPEADAAPPPADALPAARPRRFRRWRRSRPFWGGLFTLLGGLEIATIPLTAYKIMLVTPSVVIAALVGAVIAILGLLMWMTPSQNKLYGLLAILLGVASFVTSNVGGFLLGGLLSIIGGALGFAWVVVDRTPAQDSAPAAAPDLPDDGDPGPAAGGTGPEPSRA